MPPFDSARVMKNSVIASTAGDSTAPIRPPPLAAGLPPAGRAMGSGARAKISGMAAIGPSIPAAISAAPMPSQAAMPSTKAGATAPPMKPAKVWMEKARPTRSSAIEAPRMA